VFDPPYGVAFEGGGERSDGRFGMTVLVLLSPGASRIGDDAAQGRLVEAIMHSLAARDVGDIEVRRSHSARESAAALAAAVGLGLDTVVVAGGDGSVRTAATALAGSGTNLGIVAVGTGNLFAAALGLPRGPMHTARALAAADVRSVDFGTVVIDGATEGFCVGVGAGFDARVMSSATASDKARLGVGAYFAAGLRLLSHLRPAETRVVIDGRTLEYRALATLVLNCGQMAGLPGPRLAVAPDDGLLDLVAVRGEASLRGLVTAGASALGALLVNRESADGAVIRLRGRDITVATDPAEPIEVDGDVVSGSGAFRARVRPGALRVLVPE
jgi:diacylglycerol kinase family enzyme